MFQLQTIKKYREHPSMQLLLKSLRREQWTRLVVGVFVVSSGILLLYLFFGGNNLISMLSFVALIIGVRFLQNTLKTWDFENQKLLQLIENQPTKIVWVYSIVTQRMPFGLAFNEQSLLYFKLENGDDITVNIPPEKLKIVTRFLKRLLPHAVFGYTPNRMRSYLRSPLDFLQQNDGK